MAYALILGQGKTERGRIAHIPLDKPFEIKFFKFANVIPNLLCPLCKKECLTPGKIQIIKYPGEPKVLMFNSVVCCTCNSFDVYRERIFMSIKNAENCGLISVPILETKKTNITCIKIEKLHLITNEILITTKDNVRVDIYKYPFFKKYFNLTPDKVEKAMLDGEIVYRIKTVYPLRGIHTRLDISGDAGFPEIYTLNPSEFWYIDMATAKLIGYHIEPLNYFINNK